MKFSAWVMGAALVAGALALTIGPARSQRLAGVRLPKAGLQRRFPPAERLRVQGPGVQAVRGPVVRLVFNGDQVVTDTDGSGDLTRGELLVANGDIVDTANRLLGTWEGSVIDSGPDTYLLNLTLRFPGSGTVMLNGAPYLDGIASRVPALPIVGVTGRLRFRGNVGVTIDNDGSLLLALGGVS